MSLPTKRSLCLSSSHCLSVDVRTSANEPFSFCPRRKKAHFAVGQFAPQSFLCFLPIAERILATFVRRIHTAIPDDDVACAVLFFRDDAFEGGVIERMVLDLDRQSFLAKLQRWTFRNRPGLEYPVQFESKIVVQPARCVLLHDEQQRPAALDDLRSRFGRACEGALLLVFFQRTFHGSRRKNISTGNTGNTG